VAVVRLAAKIGVAVRTVAAVTEAEIAVATVAVANIAAVPVVVRAAVLVIGAATALRRSR
jgi:hypothetical protein